MEDIRKDKNFMVGNLVQVNEMAVHWNGETFKDTVFEIETVSDKKVYFKGFSSYEEYGSIRPIQLDEEWFYKYNFIRNNIGNESIYIHPDFLPLSIKFNHETKYILPFYNGCWLNYLKLNYVHELQNFYSQNRVNLKLNK